MSTSARTFLSSAVTAAALTLAVHGQTDPARPAFEVAAIKRNVSAGGFSGDRNFPGGRLSIENRPLRQVVRSAYGSADMEVVGGPGWIDADRWDIVATAATGNREAPWREMLKTLLADRFKLVAHVEPRERPIFALLFARGDKQLGPKIHSTACEGDGCRNTTHANTNGILSGSIEGTQRTIAEIGRALSPYAQRRVFDRTGLDGRYDFELTWSEDVSIFTAVQEQLGLKLEAQRAPVDVVVIDSVERPTLEHFSLVLSTRPWYLSRSEVPMAAAYSMDLRSRVLRDSDAGLSSKELAERFHVSRAWVDALKQRRRETGAFAPFKPTKFRGRALAARDRDQLTAFIAARPDATLEEIREALQTSAGLTTIWRAINQLDFTLKKNGTRRRATPARRRR